MNKQEFLAFSLPYGLKVTVQGKSNVSGEHIYMLYSAYSDTTVIEVVGESNFKTDKYKPILCPLSDLTKPIEHRGEKFVPIEKILWESNFDTSIMTRKEINSYAPSVVDIDLISLNDALLLISWHFDIANLIEKGEAIDVNTLSVNPYK